MTIDVNMFYLRNLSSDPDASSYPLIALEQTTNLSSLKARALSF